MKLVRVIIIAGAIGSMLPASAALAQANPAAGPAAKPASSKATGTAKADSAKAGAGKTGAAAAAAKPASVSGVEVQATGRSRLSDIPPEKRAAFDAEVAKADAWKRYRSSRPPTSAGVAEQAKDYPGLQALLPEP